MLDGLWQIMQDSEIDLPDMLIFVPNRRAVRSVEKMIVEKKGGAAILPKIVPLGEGVEDIDDIENQDNVVGTLERVVAMAFLISNLPSVKNISAALPIARTLVTMQDYLENSGIDIADVDWKNLVDEKYAAHFRDKAELLDIISRVQNDIFNGRQSEVKARNSAVYDWLDYIKNMDAKKSLVIVCGSTASVPVTRELMSKIALMPNGRIVLSGKISGREEDFELDTNPYNSEYKFLKQIGVSPSDIHEIDVGNSDIDFMNRAFGNACKNIKEYDLKKCSLVEASRESEEAAFVAEIATRAIAKNEKVLVITPDSAGNQRLMSEFTRRGIVADFSGGLSGATTPAGRAILNLLDDWIESGVDKFDKIYLKHNCDLFNTIAEIVDEYTESFAPQFIIDDAVSIQVWSQIKKLSDCLNSQKIRVNISDARAFIADAFAGVRVRGAMNMDAPVVVLGTIESRMQTADVVILTGLNDWMFPALGYENPWLPRKIADTVGVPSPNHKVSLMALDFMNLSCGKSVYWTRSKASGGVQTQESRFISRVRVARGNFDMTRGADILNSVRARDSVEYRPLCYDNPTPPADWSNVYVTELELLIHNPYAFYVRHILRLRHLNDYWMGPDARDFGNLVHGVLENADENMTPENLIAQMDARARDVLPKNSLLFHFWHRRFVEIAPVAVQMLKRTVGAKTEVFGQVKIAGRNVCARADRIWDGGVLDIKTGSAPSDSQLLDGNMPQLPLEALMLKTGGFDIHRTAKSQTPVMMFLQLKSGAAKIIEYDSATVDKMIGAAQNKVTDLFNMYSAGGAEYKYLPNSDVKYQEYDDFARADERD